MTNKLPPKVGHILKLADIIREVDGSNSLGAAALAEAILSHHGVGDVKFTLEDEEISNTEEFSDPCPDCGKELECAPGGGVKCSCGYWFCY